MFEDVGLVGWGYGFFIFYRQIIYGCSTLASECVSIGAGASIDAGKFFSLVVGVAGGGGTMAEVADAGAFDEALDVVECGRGIAGVAGVCDSGEVDADFLFGEVFWGCVGGVGAVCAEVCEWAYGDCIGGGVSVVGAAADVWVDYGCVVAWTG